MAKPIKETPILKGREAQKFVEQNSTPKNAEEIQRERERILENYNYFKEAERTDRHIAC